MTTRRIVAAIDLSPVSRAVVSLAERLAARFGYGVTAVFVVEPVAEVGDRSLLIPMLRRMVEETEKEFEIGFKGFCESMPPPRGGVERLCHLGKGKVHSEIIRAARVADAPLILLGAPSPSALAATTFGRILRRTPVPALIVRKPTTEGYRKAVVGVDFSPLSEGALATVGQLVEADAQILLLNVLPRLSGETIFSDHAATVEKRKSQLLDLAARVLPGRKVDVEVMTGSARSVVAERARELGADLVGVGVGASTDISEVFLGSVAEAVARNAHCDVLIHSAGRGG